MQRSRERLLDHSPTDVVVPPETPPLIVIRSGHIFEIRDGDHVVSWATDRESAASEARAYARRFRRSCVFFLDDDLLEHLQPDF